MRAAARAFSTEKERALYFIAGVGEDPKVLGNQVYRYKNWKTIEAFLNDAEIRFVTQKESTEAGLQENRLLLTESQRKFNDIQNELFQIKNSITAEESRLEYIKKEVYSITDLIDKNARKLEELNAELAGFDADVEARRGETAFLQTEIESNQHLYSQSTQAVVELKNRLEEIRQRIENEKGELIAIVTARTQVKNAMQLNLNLQREITQRLNRLAAEQPLEFVREFYNPFNPCDKRPPVIRRIKIVARERVVHQFSVIQCHGGARRSISW